MGMFDYVRYNTTCPVCGDELIEFQSKDGDCMLETIALDKVKTFYTICDRKNCETWSEYKNTKKGPILISPTKSEMKKISKIKTAGDAIIHSRNKSENVANYCMFFLRKK